MPSNAEVDRLVSEANGARWPQVTADDATPAGLADAERQLEAMFKVSNVLAVYGSLAPGQSNDHMVAPLGGEWSDGFVEGDLFQVGWGAAIGHRAFRPRAGGQKVAVKVLTSSLLPQAWPSLDHFEGGEYRRILIPVFAEDADGGRSLATVANLYAAAESTVENAER